MSNLRRTISLLVALLFLTSCTISSVLGQIAAREQIDYSEADLNLLPDEELETICITRGFELVKDEIDPATGEIYQLTHEDYVDAATRCLAIEHEMNELLAEYPELAEELEEEIRKMEAENEAKQAELDGIQKHQSQTDETFAGEVGGSFVSKYSETLAADGDRVDSSNVGTADENSDDLIVGEEESVDDATNEISGDESVDDLEDDMKTKNTSTDIESLSDTPKEDFTLSYLAIETIRAFVKHAKDDAKRIFALVVPVMQPLLTAGDVAWRQIKALFLKAREAYASYDHSSSETTIDNQQQEKQTVTAEAGV